MLNEGSQNQKLYLYICINLLYSSQKRELIFTKIIFNLVKLLLSSVWEHSPETFSTVWSTASNVKNECQLCSSKVLQVVISEQHSVISTFVLCEGMCRQSTRKDHVCSIQQLAVPLVCWALMHIGIKCLKAEKKKYIYIMCARLCFHFGKCAYSCSCWASDKKNLNTFSHFFFLVNMYQEPPAAWYLSFWLETEGKG